MSHTRIPRLRTNSRDSLQACVLRHVDNIYIRRERKFSRCNNKKKTISYKLYYHLCITFRRQAYFYFSLTHQPSSTHTLTHSRFSQWEMHQTKVNWVSLALSLRCDGMHALNEILRRKSAKNTFDAIKKASEKQSRIDVHQLNVQVSSLIEKMQLESLYNKNMTYLGRCTLASQHEEKVLDTRGLTQTAHCTQGISFGKCTPRHSIGAQRTVKIS